MGIKGPFPAMLKSSAKRMKVRKAIGDQSHFDDFLKGVSRPVVGLDMMVSIVSAVKSERGAEEYHQSPPVPAHHVALACLQLVRKLNRANVAVIPVFDEISRHPLKAAGAGVARNRDAEKAQMALDGLLELPWPKSKQKQRAILKKIKSKRRAAASVSPAIVAEVMRVFRENDVQFVVAPFEADWQLAYMLNVGLVHAIASTDSDFWALLDAPCLLINLSTGDLKAHFAVDQLHDLCWHSSCSVQRISKHPHMTRFGAIVRAAVYGNDYFAGIRGLGEKRLEPLMARYSDDELGLLRHLAANHSDFVTAYQQVHAVYSDAPVFEMKKGRFDVARGMRRFSFTGRIVSHRGLDFSPASWKRIVGFDPWELLFKKYQGPPDQGPDCVDVALGIWSAKSGRCYHEFLVPHDQNSDGEDLPFGWDLDFSKCPIHFQPKRSLERWIAVRG